jgi:hypothetical protein
MALLTTVLLPSLVGAIGNLQCDKILTGGKAWDLSALGGPHSVMTSIEQPPSVLNTTYTINICKNLERDGDVPKGDACPNYTRGMFSKSLASMFDAIDRARIGLISFVQFVQSSARSSQTMALMARARFPRSSQ